MKEFTTGWRKDTLVTIRVEDMKLALDSIVAIQKNWKTAMRRT